MKVEIKQSAVGPVAVVTGSYAWKGGAFQSPVRIRRRAPTEIGLRYEHTHHQERLETVSEGDFELVVDLAAMFEYMASRVHGAKSGKSVFQHGIGVMRRRGAPRELSRTVVPTPFNPDEYELVPPTGAQ